MATPIPPSFLTARFRAGSAFELVIFDRLQGAERERVSPWCDVPGFFGILRPRSGEELQTISRDRALLLLTLQEPATLPFFVGQNRTPAELEQEIATLVADRILEVETVSGFVSGVQFVDHFGLKKKELPRTRLAQISECALRHAAALEIDDVDELSDRLYGFGALPLTERWHRTYPGPAAVLAQLRQPHPPGWQRSAQPDSPWISWENARRGSTSGGAHFKLFVSPRPEHLPAVFEPLGQILARCRALSFKVGAQARNLLRTDKLVIYFEDLESLSEAADMLERRLAGIPIQGVPFSAQIDREGLLSWGLDPPALRRNAAAASLSWRSWISARLAGALADGLRQGIRHELAEWATTRLSLEGLDTATWSPDLHRWVAATGVENAR